MFFVFFCCRLTGFGVVESERMAVSAAIGGVPVAGGEDGGATCPAAVGAPGVRPEVRVRAQDSPENGAPSPGQSRLAITRRHALRLPPLFRLQASFFFFVSRSDLLCFVRSHSQHHTRCVYTYLCTNTLYILVKFRSVLCVLLRLKIGSFPSQ